MATTLLWIPTPHSSVFSSRNCGLSHHRAATFFVRHPLNKLICNSSLLDEEGRPPPELSHFSSKATDTLPPGTCQACGNQEIERGCNGEGRMQGGIATFPGLGWWPIKAYRPCPAFVASGGRYRRQGQSMDEVVSGRKEREVSIRTYNEDTTSKKKKSPRKFKK